MDRFNEVGVIETSPAFDRTNGWRAAFGKDIDAFRGQDQRPGRSPADVESAVDLRTHGMDAANRHAARAAARQWTRDQEGA